MFSVYRRTDRGGMGQGRYEKHFISKLTDADGEQQEAQHWVECAGDCGYLNQGQVDDLKRDLQEIGRMFESMMDKSDLFCGKRPMKVKETSSEYFTSLVTDN